MPTVGPIVSTDPMRYASTWNHATEVAQPGYYAVTLDSYATRAELTSTERAAMERFTFPSTGQANVLLAASQSIYSGLHPFSISGYSTIPTHPARVTIVGDRTLQGWAQSLEPGLASYRVYFTARFDRPFSAFGTWSGKAVHPGSRTTTGSADGGYVSFDTTRDRTVTMRAAISYIDVAGAAANLASEIPDGRAFASVRTAAHDAWNSRLHDIEVRGSDPGALALFYTNLYRVLLAPTILDDADGRYLGFDWRVHNVVPGHHHYTNLSLWDTYRSQTPLLELIEPQVLHDEAISLLDDYDQDGGLIPRWVYANLDWGIMGGDSATPTLAAAVVNGILSPTEGRRAYSAMLHQATTVPPPGAPREDLGAYLRYGYIPNDVDSVGVSVTTEYAIDDYSVAQVARRYGDTAQAAMLERRAGWWRNVVDPPTRFLRPRNSNGSWAKPTGGGPLAFWNPVFSDGYQEGTGWQYQWAVPHDVAGLAAAIGGTAATVARLDHFFSTALNDARVPVMSVAGQYSSFFGAYYFGDQYTSANEPDEWAPWYYDWLGQPWKTQKVVRAEMTTFNTRPDGLPDNDDAGQTSAWYVLAAIGLYQVAPGMAVWEMNSPALSIISIRPQHGTPVFTITAAGASTANLYVQSARLDGVPLDRTYLWTSQLVSGSHLDVVLGSRPNLSWAAGADAAPPSLSRQG